MNVIPLTPLDLALAAVLVVVTAGLGLMMRLGVGVRLLIAAARMTVQLIMIGFVLKALFSYVHLGWIGLTATLMLLIAGREVVSRQERRLARWWGFGIGTGAMFISSFSIMILTLTLVVQPTPWYAPQYAIPMLGMLLGNTMTGISLGMDRLTSAAWRQRTILEARLLLGQTSTQAISDIRVESMRGALIPIMNTMAAAGLVSLPGMMTGQILAGSPPLEAVKYQILIMFLIAAGVGLGTMFAVWLTSRHLFDERHRLRLDRLVTKA
jgi:putative ABC transport system permease protein